MEWYQALDAALGENLPDLRLVRDEPLSRHTSLKIGGNATRMAFPTTPEQLVLTVSLAQDCGARPFLLGKGSNLLVGDRGLHRLVVNTTALVEPLEVEGTTIRATAGISLARLADFAQKQGLTGLEFAHGIPGTLGGGLVMNAGAYGGELSQVVESVTVLDLDAGVQTFSCAQMDFGYRHSIVHHRPELVILGATLRLTSGDKAEIRARMDTLIAQRKAKQPLEFPSAGSTFKRPEGHFAGALIEQCGLKGFAVGGAQVSEKHAGFVINRGGATCSDMLALMDAVRDKVLAETGVVLEPEVQLLTED